jgi:hypothetical protein
MMQNKKGCSSLIWIILGLVFLVVLVCGGGYFIVSAKVNRLESIQALNAPPTVMIDTPPEDMVVAPGNLLDIGAIASGNNRIERIELWMDGVKTDEAINTETPDLTTFSADFSLIVPEGEHMLVARAVDSTSLVGQSLPRLISADAGFFAEEQPGAVVPENPPPTQESPPTPTLIVPNIPSLETSQITGTYTLIDLITGDTSASHPPKAPSNLQVQVQDCKMTLTWQDNADNELAYGVWVKDVIGPAHRIASLKPSQSTGQAWFQFDVLPIGVYGIWVEAVNWLGAQPSEMAWVRVSELGCPVRTATELEFTVKKFDISGPYQGVYCYVSAEGGTYTRFPPEPDYFNLGPGFPVLGGSGAKPTGIKKYVFKIPEDRVLDLQGDCYAETPANTPNLLIGQFNVSIPESDWDGQEHAITIGSELWYTLQPLGLTTAKGLFYYIDSSLTAPKIVKVEKRLPPGSNDPNDLLYSPYRYLEWEWKGTPQEETELTGFTVYLNGSKVQQVDKRYRFWNLHLPAICGKVATYEVVANFGSSQSVKYRWDEVLPDCPVQVKVEYQQIYLERSDPSVTCSGGGCTMTLCSDESMLVSFFLQARFNDTVVDRTSNHGFEYPAINCGTWDLESLLPPGKYPAPATVLTSQLSDVGGFQRVTLRSSFYNEAGGWVAYVEKKLVMTIDEWAHYDETFELPFSEEDGTGWISVHVTGTPISP